MIFFPAKEREREKEREDINKELFITQKIQHTSGIKGAPIAFEDSISQHMSFNHACFLSLLKPASPTPMRLVISRVSNARIKSTASGETFGSLGNSMASFRMDFCNSSFVFALNGLCCVLLIKIDA